MIVGVHVNDGVIVDNDLILRRCGYLQECQEINPKGVSQPRPGHALEYQAVLRSV